MSDTVGNPTDTTRAVSDLSDTCRKKSPDESPAVEVDLSGIPDMSQAKIKFYHKSSFMCSMCDEPNYDKTGRIDHSTGNGSKQLVQFWEINYLSQVKEKDLNYEGKSSSTGGPDEKTCGGSWKVGDPCVAQWTEDGCWYRSLITSIHENQKVLVKFVEYGNSDYTQLGHLKSPHTKIGEAGELLTQDCDPTNTEIEGSVVNPDTATNEAKQNYVQQIEKLNEHDDKGGLGEKEKKWKEGDECVAQWSEDKCWYKSVIEKIESTEKVLVRFTDYGNSDYSSMSSLKFPDTKIDENGQIEHFGESSNENNDESENGNWKVGDNCVAQWKEDSLWYKSCIVRIDSPEQVLVKFIEFGNEDFTSLDSLKPFDTCLSGDGELLPNTEMSQNNWKVGDKCVAEWTEDNCWYRSVIESIESKDTVLVNFIDYGNSDYTSLEKLLPYDTPINEEGQIQRIQGQINEEEPKIENGKVDDECVDGHINEEEPKNENEKIGDECVNGHINEEEPKNENWKVGDKCVAQWREDNLWYKSCIVKIESAEKVLVKFIEYGNEDFTSMDSLKPIDTRIDENGQLLANTTNIDCNWKEGDNCVAQWSEDLLWYKSVICKIENSGRVLVKFIEFGNSDYTSIGNLKPFETPIGEDGHVVVAGAIDATDENKNLWKEGDKCVAQWKEDELWYKGVVSKIESKDKVLIIFTDYGNTDYTSLDELKPFDTEIGEEGTIVDVTEEEKKSSDVNSKMSNDGKWKVGDECVAQWEEDKCWYKSKIIEIKSNNQVLVEFIEYGNSDYTLLSMLKPINTEIINGQLKGEIFKDNQIEQNVTENEGKSEKMSPSSMPIINGSSNANEIEVCSSIIKIEKAAKDDNLKEARNNVDNDSMTLSWKEGDLCVAQWSEDGLWYRSKITKLHSNSKVEVIFTEYGNTDLISMDLLKPHDTSIGEDGQLLETSEGVSAMPVFEASQTSEAKIEIPSKWKIGASCVAQWKEDGLWYNSAIQRIELDGQVEVVFTEYGNTDFTSIDLLKPPGTLIGEDGKLVEEGCGDVLASEVDSSANVDTREIEWRVGDKCIAQWREDSNWYNGIIESINGSTARIKFIDYGNTDFTDLKMLKPITTTGLVGETRVFKPNEIEAFETCNSQNIVVISKDDDASPSVLSSKEATFNFPKSETDKQTAEVFSNGKKDNSTLVSDNEVTDVIPESESGVHCESYVEESLPLDSTKVPHENESLEVNKTELDFLDHLSKNKPEELTSVLSHLDASQDLISPQFKMCQVDGSTSLSLIDSLMKIPKVGDGPSISGPETSLVSPRGSTTSLPSNSDCVFLGRVQSLAVHEQGAKYLVALTNPDTVSTIQEELMADALSMMLNPVATKVFQAVIDVPDNLDNILEVVLKNFDILSSDKVGSKIVQKVLIKVPSDQKQAITVKLEKEGILSKLLQSQPGTNVAQACLPYIQEPSVTFIADLLLGNIVKFGNNPNGSYFIQLFVTNNNSKITKVIKDRLMAGIANNVDHFVKDKFGTWLAQTAVKVSQSARHVFQFSSWVRDNILDVYCDPHAMRFSSSVIEALVKICNDEENTLENVANRRESEKILLSLVFLMTDTRVAVGDRSVPLIVAASMDPYGHVLAREVCLQARDVSEIKTKFIEVFSEYKSKLQGDVFGCLVLKGLEGLL